MVLGIDKAAKEKASRWGDRCCASTRPRPRCCRIENARLGLATNFRQVAPRPKRCKPAKGIREKPSFTVKPWWGDQTQQGGGGGSGADQVEARARQVSIKGNVAAEVDPAPAPEADDIHSSEPLANRGVQRALRDAYAESNPGEGPDPKRMEQGGYIIRRSSAIGRFLFGEYTVARWEASSIDSIYPPPPPEGAEVVGSFHTHPNNGIDWRDGSGFLHSASPQDWVEWGHGVDPHYIVSGSGIYRIGNDTQSYLGPLTKIF